MNNILWSKRLEFDSMGAPSDVVRDHPRAIRYHAAATRRVDNVGSRALWLLPQRASLTSGQAFYLRYLGL